MCKRCSVALHGHAARRSTPARVEAIAEFLRARFRRAQLLSQYDVCAG
jgi:hypothetical protein